MEFIVGLLIFGLILWGLWLLLCFLWQAFLYILCAVAFVSFIIYFLVPLIILLIEHWPKFPIYFADSKRKSKKMFDKFSVNPHLKKFARLTFHLDANQYSALKNYFKVMSIDLENANKFLESCKGIAFLEGFAKHPLSGGTLNFSEISKLIVETERSEQILSCAYDILKEY